MDVLHRLSSAGTKDQVARLAAALLVAALPIPSIAADNAALISFARANAEKFDSEIAAGPVQVGSVLTLKGRYDSIDMTGMFDPFTPYDGRTHLARFASVGVSVWHLQLAETCRPAGSFTGQNAFGAKANVRRETCERFWASDVRSGGVSVSGMTMELTPEEYRVVKSKGVDVEVVFKIAPTKTGEVVKIDEGVNTATLDNPVETRLKVWDVKGEIQEVRFKVPGRETSFVMYPR
jgi:hypothetical protein